MEVPFPRFPSSFIAGLVPFIVAGMIIFTSYPLGRAPFPHPVIFYLSIFFSVAITAGLIGWGNLVEELGFDATVAGEKPEMGLLRYLVLVPLGLATTYIIYNFVTGGGMYYYALVPFPMDFALAQSLLSYPFIIHILNCFIVALFEEIQRNAGAFCFANALAKRGWDKWSSVLVGNFIASICFILLHVVAWAFTPNIFSYIFGIMMAMLFSMLGYVLSVKEFGPFYFPEFSIIPGMMAHFLWDTLVVMNMRVLPVSPLSLALGVVKW